MEEKNLEIEDTAVYPDTRYYWPDFELSGVYEPSTYYVGSSYSPVAIAKHGPKGAHLLRHLLGGSRGILKVTLSAYQLTVVKAHGFKWDKIAPDPWSLVNEVYGPLVPIQPNNPQK